MQKLLIATGNPGKVKELQVLLDSLDVELVTPRELGFELEVVEDGKTYQENAGKKALAYSKASGLMAFADDSGLEVDLLNGAPGLYSARYSPLPGATDADRRAFMLKNLTGKPQPWTAHFHATVAIGMPGKENATTLHYAEGDCFGEIIMQERGNNGFGYDPIFFIPETNCTMAELSMQQKNTLSHRARAVKNALPILRHLLNG